MAVNTYIHSGDLPSCFKGTFKSEEKNKEKDFIFLLFLLFFYFLGNILCQISLIITIGDVLATIIHHSLKSRGLVLNISPPNCTIKIVPINITNDPNKNLLLPFKL